jgi:hypothetical protein
MQGTQRRTEAQAAAEAAAQGKAEAQLAEDLARQMRIVQKATEQSRGLAQGGPQAVYRGYEQLRNELRAQLEALQEQRDEISDQLQNPMVNGANREGLSKRIQQLDARIAVVDQQIGEVESAVARAGALPGVRPVTPPEPRREFPEELIAVPVLFILCVFLPLSIAYARRIWRRSAAAVTSLPHDISERLARLDQNLDTVALEVERIGEGQRFLTRAFAEQQRGLSAGGAERVEVPEREQERQRRGG